MTTTTTHDEPHDDPRRAAGDGWQHAPDFKHPAWCAGHCADCGACMNTGEANTFTCCDQCWDGANPLAGAPAPAAVAAAPVSSDEYDRGYRRAIALGQGVRDRQLVELRAALAAMADAADYVNRDTSWTEARVVRTQRGAYDALMRALAGARGVLQRTDTAAENIAAREQAAAPVAPALAADREAGHGEAVDLATVLDRVDALLKAAGYLPFVRRRARAEVERAAEAHTADQVAKVRDEQPKQGRDWSPIMERLRAEQIAAHVMLDQLGVTPSSRGSSEVPPLAERIAAALRAAERARRDEAERERDGLRAQLHAEEMESARAALAAESWQQKADAERARGDEMRAALRSALDRWVSPRDGCALGHYLRPDEMDDLARALHAGNQGGR
jgi:hypothetical protein